MTIGTSIGNGLGYVGAVTKHAAIRTVTITGQFGSDVYNGTIDGYDRHDERLAAIRAAGPVTRPTRSIAAKAKAKA